MKIILLKLCSFLKQIFIGPKASRKNQLDPAIKNNIANLKEIWRDSSFGIERICRLMLILSGFLSLLTLIKQITKNEIRRKFFIEIYVLLKLIFPLFSLIFHLYISTAVLIINIYFMLDTIFYLFRMFFLSDIYKNPISLKRTIILLSLNYIQLNFVFSLLYIGFGLINKQTLINAVYFSFITSTTLGYGDISPINSSGKVITIFHVFLMLMFVMFFINKVVSELAGRREDRKNKKK